MNDSPQARYLRWLYRGGRPSRFARAQNRLSAALFSTGIAPKRVATLEVPGRRSGRLVKLPVVIADYEGERYLVSMLGEGANWVANVRANHNRAVLRHGRTESIELVDVSPAERGPVLRRYLDRAPGARPHIQVDRRAPEPEIAAAARTLPMFRIVPVERTSLERT